MTHSLRLADAQIQPEQSIAVLPADLVLIERANVALVLEEARNGAADVAYPVDGAGNGGHPVVFSPTARERLRQLSDGDTLKMLRDAPELTRYQIETGAEWPTFDMDDELDRAAAEAALRNRRTEPPALQQESQ